MTKPTMLKLYRFSSIIYRLVLALLIPAILVGNIVGSVVTGHPRDLNWNDYSFILYLAITVPLLTLYVNMDNSFNLGKTILFFIVACLVLISIAVQLYTLYEKFFICKCFTVGDNLTSGVVFIFLMISIVVFAGLITNHRAQRYMVNF